PCGPRASPPPVRRRRRWRSWRWRVTPHERQTARSVEKTDQVRPRVHIERQEDGGHVVLHRAQRELGRLADFLVTAALEDQLENLKVSRPEFRDAIVVRSAGELREALGQR